MDGIRQRASMAMGKGMDSGNFGVKSWSESMKDGKSMGSSDGTTLSDKQRCSPVGQGGKMASQRQPDHGTHGRYDT
jgi:hypothetical protein